MPTLDLSQQETQADGTLGKIGIKADGREDEGFVYTVEVSFVVESQESARVIQSVVPGAESIYTKAKHEDDWKYNTTVTPAFSGVKAKIQDIKRDLVGIEGGCDVKAVKLRASKAAVTMTLVMVFGGQTAAQAGVLTGLLGSTVSLELTRDQQVLPFPKAKLQPKPGDVVVAYDGGTAFVGRLVETDEQNSVLEDFDNEYRVSNDNIASVIRLTGDVAALRRSFKTRCARRKITPSWEAIVLSLGQDRAAITREGGEVTLTAEVIERAVGCLEAGEELLPPEAGEEAAQGSEAV